MSLIIETNLLIDPEGQIRDHQSRIIKVDSWESYIEEIKTGETPHRMSYLGYMQGMSFPRFSRIENFTFDNCHLSYDLYSSSNVLSKKFAYLVE